MRVWQVLDECGMIYALLFFVVNVGLNVKFKIYIYLFMMEELMVETKVYVPICLDSLNASGIFLVSTA